MPSIDERVVAMAFENQVFETRVAQTISTLGKLDTAVKNISNAKGLEDIEKAGNKVTLNAPMSALDKLRAKLSRSGEGAAQGFSDIERASNKVTLEGTGKAIDKTQAKLDQLGAGSTFSDIEKAANQVELSGISKAIQSVSGQFSILSGAAAVAFGNIASQAAMRGAAFGKSFAIGPITDGLHEYQTNLKSIQTILANTEGQQVSGLQATNRHLEELNKYSDQTIYNFSEMAKNIGTFTAAGVDLPRATASIKGIANLAALSGSSSQQASTAMYQLSQAIASGRVSLQDWNSVVNAGMGGAKFQQALMRTAENFGALEKGAVQIDKATGKATVNGQSFRESIMARPGETSWLSEKVLVETLRQFTGDMKEADLIAQGFSKTQAQAIMQQAATAKAAATEVKTLSQAFEVARESIGSGWAKTFQLIFGDFKESKKTFTEFSNTLNDFINRASDARNKVLGEWDKLGGRTVLIEGIKQAFDNLMQIVNAVKDAFQDVFPPATGKSLFNLTKGFAGLMDRLDPSPRLLNNLREIFGGLFAVLHIGWEIVKGLIGVVGDLLGVVGKGSGGILDFAGGVGEFLKAIDTALTKGGLLNAFFETLSNILQAPMTMIMAISKAIFGMFNTADPARAQSLGDAMEVIGEKVKPMADVLDKASGAWQKFQSILKDVGDLVSPWFQKIAEEISNLGHILADAIRNADFDMVFAALNTTFLGGLFLVIKKALGGGLAEQFGGGLLTNISESFGALTGHLQAMQKNVQATMILKIAAAIGLLAAGVFVLSKIEPKALAQAMGAISIGLGQMVAVMAVMTKIGAGFGTVPAMAAGMVLMAGAMLILAGAVKIFATMSWEDMIKGLTGVAGAMTAIGVGMKLLGPGTLIQGPALIAIGLALNVIAVAVKQFADLKWEDLARGILGLGAALAVMAGAMLLMPPNMIVSGAGLVAMSFGVTVLAGAIAAMGNLDVKTIAKGILGIALAMTALSVAILGFPPTLALQAGGLVILSVALSGIAGAIGLMGSLGIGKLIKGITAMGAALGVLSVGLYLMIGSAPGAVALIAAAGAFAILGPAIALLGNLDWGTIFKGLAAIALTLGTLAIAGTIAVIPLTALGGALAVLGLGLTAVTIPIYILAKALSLLGSEGAKGVGVMVAALTAFVALLPKIIIDFVKGLVGIIAAVAEVAPKVVESLGIIIGSVLAAISLAIPKLEAILNQLFGAFVRIINAQAGPVIAAGIALLLKFMGGISQNMSRVIDKGAEIVRKFLDGITRNAPSIIASGLRTVLTFMQGITSGLPRLVAKAFEMINKFLAAVTSRMPETVVKGAQLVVKFINGVASKIGTIVAAGINLITKFLAGVAQGIPKIAAKATDVAVRFVHAVGKGTARLVDEGFKAVINFLNGTANAIRDRGPELRKAGWNVADAILDGIVGGFKEMAHRAVDAVSDVIGALPKAARKILGIKSPSQEFWAIGKHTMQGLSKGVIDNRTDPQMRFREVGKRSMQGLQQGLKENAKSVRDTGAGIAGGLLGAMRDVLQIRSPSQAMRDIGKLVGEGFAQGLHGSKDDIRNSFKDLRERLRDEMRAQRDAIREENKKLEDLEEQFAEKRAKLRELRKYPKKNAEEIAAVKSEMADLQDQIDDSEKAIDKYEKILRGATGAHTVLTKSLQDEKAKLIGMSTELETVTSNLEKAQSALDQITQARAQFIESTTEQYSQLPDEGKLLADALAEAELTAEEVAEKRQKAAEEAERKRRINQVANYKKALQEQIEATRKYQETLQKLRELGLDDATYKKLLSRGLEGQEFATQLAATGREGVAELNRLDAELLAVSEGLAVQSAENLYKAGVDAAQGLVDGLKQRQDELKAAMDFLADSMVSRIKAALGIRSPSRVFTEIGRFTMAGFKDGLDRGSADVESAAQNAVDAAKEAFSKISTEGLVDVDPTITPILDLSQVRKEAQKLGDLTNVVPITAAASFGQASAISQERAATTAEAAAQAEKNVTQVEFNQYNTSPESLSDTEIYRQTNNQLSQLRSVLGLRPKSYSA